jgi:hypothetical protein
MFRQYFQRFLETGAYCTPPGRAACAIKSARTLIAWQQAKADGRVRINAEEEQESFSDVFGEEIYEREKAFIELHGCHYVYTEYLAPDGRWHHADSIGMVVCRRPDCPFENCYAIGLMSSALDQLNEAWTLAGEAI